MNNSTKITTLTNRKNMFYWQMDRPLSAKQIDEIFLQRHNRFDPEITKSMIEYGMLKTGKSKSNHKVVELSQPIKAGSVNIGCKATLADGTKLVIRIHPQEIANGYFWVESIASQYAKDAGIPSFSTYFIDDSHKKFPNDFMIIEQLPGTTMQHLWPIKPNFDKSFIEETGKYLALIHSIKTQGFGFFDNQIAKKEKRLHALHDQWKKHIYAAFSENLDYLTKMHVITFKERKTIENIFSNNESIIRCDSSRLVHNDVADWNQLVNNNHISGIIDWDECFSGDPVCDFSTWTVFFPFERFAHLKNGYQQITPLPDGFEEKFHLYRVRYIISKLVGRKKKLVYGKSQFTQKLYDYALKILQDEFKFYGY